MTNYEYVKQLSNEDFERWFAMMLAKTMSDEDFNRWVIYRDQCKKFAKEYLNKQHKN